MGELLSVSLFQKIKLVSLSIMPCRRTALFKNELSKFCPGLIVLSWVSLKGWRTGNNDSTAAVQPSKLLQIPRSKPSQNRSGIGVRRTVAGSTAINFIKSDKTDRRCRGIFVKTVWLQNQPLPPPDTAWSESSLKSHTSVMFGRGVDRHEKEHQQT